MIDDLDAELKDFIDQCVTSFLAWDLLVYFHKNPDGKSSSTELAENTGRGPMEIEMAARDLEAQAILESDGKIYQYTEDDEMRALVGKFIKALDDREKRLLVLVKVLRRR